MKVGRSTEIVRLSESESVMPFSKSSASMYGVAPIQVNWRHQLVYETPSAKSVESPNTLRLA